MKNDNLPPNCPMRSADYDHYCPSPAYGPSTYTERGACYKQDQCTKVVSDFKKMNVPKTSKVMKSLT
jgi:hypothetical protein